MVLSFEIKKFIAIVIESVAAIPKDFQNPKLQLSFDLPKKLDSILRINLKISKSKLTILRAQPLNLISRDSLTTIPRFCHWRNF